MRPDLAKCTTERSRNGGWYSSSDNKYGGKIPIHPDPEHDYPKEYGGFRSSARRRHRECKEFTDVLNPLIGNIRKNVGRPWNDVYSEFCQHLDRRSVSGFHIWTHLMQEVETNTYMRDGVVYERPKYYSRLELPVDGYYVHPVTGILSYKERVSYKAHRRAQQKKEVVLKAPDYPGWEYKLIDGLWFRIRSVEVKTIYGSYFEIEKKSANKKEIAWIKKQRILSK